MESYAFLKGCLYKMETAIGREPPGEPPLRRYEYDRRPRGPLEKPYSVSYPHPDPRYEHEKRSHQHEMEILDRVVELLAADGSRGEVNPEMQGVHRVFANLEAIGDAARLVDDLGSSIGLSKGWLRSEVLKGLEATQDLAAERAVGARTAP
jgi:hypothetical protein